MGTVQLGPSKDEIDRLGIGGGRASYGWRDVCITATQGQASLEGIEGTLIDLRQFVRRNGDRVGLIVCLEGRRRPPEDEVRERLTLMRKELRSLVRFQAIVFDGGGFLAGLVISVMSSLHRMRATEYPERLCRGVPEAAAWAAPQMSVETSAPELRRAIERVRAQTSADLCGQTAQLRAS